VTVEDAGLDNDLATTDDNNRDSRDFTFFAGVSTAKEASVALLLHVRGEPQTLSIAANASELFLALQQGLWFGLGGIDLTGISSSTLTVPTNRLSERFEIETEAWQSLQFAEPSQWVLWAWDHIASPIFRPVVLQSNNQSILHIAGQNPWKNFISPYDVTNDGKTSVLDALTIINELSRGSFVDLNTNQLRSPSELSEWPGIYYDTNGDDRATVLDALLVINDIARTNNTSGEGELTDAAIHEWSRDLTPISIANQTSHPLTAKVSSPSQRPSFSREIDDYVTSPQVVDAEYESIGSESLKTLDESLVSLLAE